MLYEQELQLCLYCQVEIEETPFFGEKENPVFLKLYNRIPVHSAQTLYVFRKQGAIQKMIHAIKYKTDYRTAFYFGKQLAKKWKAEKRENIDVVIPIPMHTKKLRERGYNQSEQLCLGFAQEMGCELLCLLQRMKHIQSQTKKNINARSVVLEEVYALKKEADLTGKVVLLMDDVITTGATFEICGELVKKCNPLQMHVLGLAYAEK
jgi:ComF family protein